MADGLPEDFPTLVVEGCPDAIIYADADGHDPLLERGGDAHLRL